jgi:glycosyltransferase involved in cell wall biosynthesis
MARVVMLVGKQIRYDARVRRAAGSLAAHGYEVTIACRAVNGEPATTADEDGYLIAAAPIPSRRDRIRRLKASLRAVRAERLKLKAGDAPGLAELQRAETQLLQRLERLSQSQSPDTEQPYRRAWAEMLCQAAPDVIHVHDHPGLATALAVRQPGTAVVYDAHEHTLGKDLNPARRPDLERYLRRYAPRADAVITVGSAIAELLVRELDLPVAPSIVHNTPSLSHAKPAPYDLRAAVGVGAATPLLVYTGSLTRRRRLDTVLRALVDLPDVRLAVILVQDGPEVAAAAQDLGIGDRVHFPPPVPHDALVSLVRGADVGVNPLDRYGNGDIAMPNKLFEYLHAELPMVVSDSPQMAAFVREHRLGEIAPADDPGAWAKAIARVLANPDDYRGEPAARERLRRQWSWEADEAVLLGLYERLVASRSSR